MQNKKIIIFILIEIINLYNYCLVMHIITVLNTVINVKILKNNILILIKKDKNNNLDFLSFSLVKYEK